MPSGTYLRLVKGLELYPIMGFRTATLSYMIQTSWSHIRKTAIVSYTISRPRSDIGDYLGLYISPEKEASILSTFDPEGSILSMFGTYS